MKNVMFFLFVWLTLQFMLAIDIFSQAPEKCGTFSPEVLAKIGLACNRPVLSSTEYTIESTNFIIHFTSDDPPPLEIIPSDDKTTYQYAQKVKIAAEEAWNFQINNLGWQAPPSDGTCGGGDGKYDIYIKGLNYYGVTTPETEESGTNGYSSYIEITTKLLRSDDVYTPLTDDEIKVTIAHEFNHALQFGYNGTKLSAGSVNNSWFYENTATWMEEIQYPNINEWITYFLNNPSFASPLKEPYLPINHISNQYQYSGALFCHLLSRWFNNNFIKNIWMFASQSGSSSSSFLSDINSVLENNNQSLKTALKRYALWRYFTGQRDDGNHFPKGHLYPTAKVLRAHSDGTGSGSSSPDNLSSVGGTSYITYRNANGVIDINFDGQDNTEFSVIALNKRIHFPDMENDFTLNTSNDGTVNNLSCIGEDHVILIPVVTKWQSQQSDLIYSYTSTLATGVPTSFWTERGEINISAGTLSVQLSQPINSGHSRNLANFLNYREKTTFERFADFQGKPIKHNNWNNINNRYFLANDFVASEQNNRQSAKYNSLEYSKIRFLLEGNIISGKGSGSFHDPWYVLSNGSQPGNNWIDFTTEYEPTGKEGATEKGVFLNQPYTGNNPVYYSVKAEQIQNISLSNSGRTHKFYFQNWAYDPNKISLQYPNALETGVVFKEANAQLSANYKGTQLTSTAEALTRNGANKFVSLTGSDLFLAYESMGNIWFENSTDGGATWSLLNNGHPVNQLTAKEPVVVKLTPSRVLVVYFEDGDPWAFPPENGKIKGIIYDIAYNQIVDDYIIKVWEDWETFTFSETPYLTMSYSSSGYPRGIVAWSEGNDVFYVYLKFNPSNNQITQISQPAVCLSMEDPITDLSIASAPSFESFPLTFHITGVWNNNSTTSTDLIYRKMTAANSSSNYLSGSGLYYVSNGSGYSLNQYPSLVEVVSGGQSAARIVWRGERERNSEEQEMELNKSVKNDESSTSEESREAHIVLVDPETPNNFWVFGSRGNANKPVIVRTNPLSGTNKGYAFAWSENEGNLHYYVKNSTLSMTGYNGSGKDIQLTSGIDGNNNLTHLRALGLTYNSTPYYLQASGQIIGGLQKENKSNIKQAREGIVYKGKSTFYFGIGDITVDGLDVEFIEFPDSIGINNINQFNSYLETKPFAINNQAQFYYSVQYGVTDSALVVNVLNAGDMVNYQVELIDAITNEVIGIFDEITFNSENVAQYANLSYKVITEGIGEKTVKLRLKVTENIGANYSIARKINDGYSFGKRGYKEINYTGTEKPTEYALYQNYPNPFNPTTTINYQIPKEGLVTLKIYDILGKEVATLLNEEKQAGKYSIEFNASNLSSGVYLYELRSNEYISTKKLLLMK